MERKQKIIGALRAFAEQRAGMEPGNYGYGMDGYRAYRRESASVTRDLHDARELIRAIEWRDSITAEAIIAATRAFSIKEREDGGVYVDYCTGQYFPTEYRKAVCAVCSQVLWDWTRDYCMPAPQYAVNGSKSFATRAEADEYAKRYLPAIVAIEERRAGKTPGDYLRSTFKREYGRRLASRYFD